MKKKQLFAAMLAVMLVLGFMVSCDDGSGKTDPPAVPHEFTGSWGAGTPILVINANGTGTILLGSVLDCTYEHSKVGGIDKLTIIIEGVGECTYDVSIVAGELLLENPTNAALEWYADNSPFAKYVPPVVGELPAELIGTWKATSGAAAGKEVFVINTVNPQVFLSNDAGATGALGPCVWSSTASGKLTLTWDGTAFSLDVMECTFDYSINGSGQLDLSNPTGDATSVAVLGGYVPWGPFEK